MATKVKLFKMVKQDGTPVAVNENSLDYAMRTLGWLSEADYKAAKEKAEQPEPTEKSPAKVKPAAKKAAAKK